MAQKAHILTDYLLSLLFASLLCGAIYVLSEHRHTTKHSGFAKDTLGFKYDSRSIDESVENGWYLCSYRLDTLTRIANPAFYPDTNLWCEKNKKRYRRGFSTERQRIYVGDSIEGGFVINSEKLLDREALNHQSRWLTSQNDTIGGGYKWNTSYNVIDSMPDTLVLEIEGKLFICKGEIWLGKE